MSSYSKRILVVGGGISGISTALEAAEAGYEVFILEKEPSLGGRVARMEKYFPKLCPPYCGMEINFKRIRRNPAIRYFTLAELEKVTGSPGAYEVSIKQKPRYVNENCTACGKCVDVCPVERSDDFNYGMKNNKAIYSPHEMAFPPLHVIDDTVCKGSECAKCVEVCPYDAIELDQKPSSFKIDVGSIVIATGWQPYDMSKLDLLGSGQYKNVISNVMMERLAAPNGPTAGKIQRPGDGKDVSKVAFVQCAGSRDENHLPYCSGVCCLATLKQTTYIRERNPEAEITVFYIDLRARGKYEDLLITVQNDDKTKLQKGKVAKIEEDPATGDLMVTAEDTLTGDKITDSFDMVVLATGMVPNGIPSGVISDLRYDEYGFANPVQEGGGIFSVGVAKKPTDVATCVQDSTGAAIRAIQAVMKGGLTNG